METTQFSFKDFEKVTLKATQNMEMGNRLYTPGEPIATFDKIQIAGLNETIQRVSANGGFDNRAHVWWETTKEIRLNFSQGVFSKAQFALLKNARVIEFSANQSIEISEIEELESNEDKNVVLSHVPLGDLFVYDLASGMPVTYTYISGATIQIDQAYQDLLVSYVWGYEGGATEYKFGQRLFNGVYYLEGRTRVKDDTTGQATTGIIRIPKLKLMSDLSIRLGKQVNPVVGSFQATGIPVGGRGNTYVSEFIMLGDDIGADL